MAGRDVWRYHLEIAQAAFDQEDMRGDELSWHFAQTETAKKINRNYGT